MTGNWSKQLSKSQGKHYWFNSRTGGRVWTDNDLPDLWGFDFVDGQKSYFHVDEPGKKSFTKPTKGETPQTILALYSSLRARIRSA
jgi:hypothetical protein